MRHTLSFCFFFFLGGGILISPRSRPQEPTACASGSGEKCRIVVSILDVRPRAVAESWPWDHYNRGHGQKQAELASQAAIFWEGKATMEKTIGLLFTQFYMMLNYFLYTVHMVDFCSIYRIYIHSCHLTCNIAKYHISESQFIL